MANCTTEREGNLTGEVDLIKFRFIIVWMAR